MQVRVYLTQCLYIWQLDLARESTHSVNNTHLSFTNKYAEERVNRETVHFGVSYILLPWQTFPKWQELVSLSLRDFLPLSQGCKALTLWNMKIVMEKGSRDQFPSLILELEEDTSEGSIITPRGQKEEIQHACRREKWNLHVYSCAASHSPLDFT